MLNPGQVADLVLAWRQVAGLIDAIPHDRPLVDDMALAFRLPPPTGAVAERPAAPKRVSARPAAKVKSAAKAKAKAKPKAKAKVKAKATAAPKRRAAKPVARKAARRRR
jgi:hypothetical protein